MLNTLFRAVLIVVLMTGLPLAPAAQVLPTLKSADGQSNDADTAALTEAIRNAAASGVGVVVVDSSGKLVAAVNPEQDGSDPSAGADSAHSASPLMRAQSEMRQFRATLRNRLEVLPNSVNEVLYILRATSPTGSIMIYLQTLGWYLLFFAIGWFLTMELYGKRFAMHFVVARVLENPQGYHEKMPFLVFRFLMGIGGTLFNMALAYLAGWLILGSAEDVSIQFTVLTIFSGFFITRTISDLWRMILSPYLSQYRIPKFSDKAALRLYHWATVLAVYSVVTILFSTWIADFGLNYNVYAIMYAAMSLFGALMNIAMVLFNGRAISNAIRNGREPQMVAWITRAISYAWAPVLIVYFVVAWLQLAFDLILERPQPVPAIAGAYGVFLAIVVVYGVINYVIERYFARRRELAQLDWAAPQAELAAEDAPADEAAPPETPKPIAPPTDAASAPEPAPGTDVEETRAAAAEFSAAETAAADYQALSDAEKAEPTRPPLQPAHSLMTFEDLARRVAGILAFVAGAYAMLLVWDPENKVLTESIAGRSLDVIVILFVGYVTYSFFRIWIDRKIADETVDEADGELGDEGGASSASRLGTLLPLFRGAILAVVVVSIVLIALLDMGVNVSPLFAGAGVVGLAVGFGAQTLVRDIFSGAFFLIDDAFRKGEYIDIGEVKGTVEKISVRSFQLRHHLGALNTIPFGEIKVLTNYSRDWVIMKLPLRVTYDTDVEKVRKLIKNLGIALQDDPVIGDSFIQPLKSQGVIEMQDSAMIIRVKFMTKPGDQFLVRKRVYEEIRELFAREGIKFAHREVTVRLADGKADDLNEAQKKAVAGAVERAIEDEDIDGGGSGGHGDDR